MVESAEVVRVGGRDGMDGGGMLRKGLITLGHQLGNGLEKCAVGLNEILDRRDQFLPFALRERNKIVGTKVLCVHNALYLSSADGNENKKSSGAGTRTPISSSKNCCPAIERPWNMRVLYPAQSVCQCLRLSNSS